MTALSAIAPTTAALHRHVARAATKTNPNPEGVASSLLKYVILRDATGAEHIIIFSAAIQHSAMVHYDCATVAAGFILTLDDLLSVPDIGSDTLGIGPRKKDKQLIAAFLGLTT
jgi:hypothetical protein